MLVSQITAFLVTQITVFHVSQGTVFLVLKIAVFSRFAKYRVFFVSQITVVLLVLQITFSFHFQIVKIGGDLMLRGPSNVSERSLL